jgi:outer membrane receptor protein involved in Fe transport
MATGRVRSLLPLLALALLLVSGPHPLLAQATPSTLRGIVVDRDGNPLPGVTLVLSNPSMGVPERGVVTDPQGEFRLPGIAPGKAYQLRATLPGYQQIAVEIPEIPAGRTVVQHLTLLPALVVHHKVVGRPDTVDVKDTTTRTSINAEFISGLPVLGRDYQDILTLTPGVTDVNNTGNPNIHGARADSVITRVEGANTTDPFTGQFGQQLNSESIAEIEVVTAGASAEHGRAQGGFVNIITKSGSNDFQGTFKLFVRTDRLDGDGAGIDPAEIRSGLGETDGFRSLSFSHLLPFLSVSGPILRDRLWYYVAPEYIQQEDPVNAGTQAFVSRTISLRSTAKVSWQMSPGNKASFLLLYDDTRQENQGLNTLTDLDSGFTNRRGGPTITLQHAALLSPAVSVESTISRFDQKFSLLPTIDPDTNGNGILSVDSIAALGGNQDGFLNLRETDPGQDFDGDGAYDVFEDFNRNGILDGCVTDPVTLERICHPPIAPQGEDQDHDGRLTPAFGCEGFEREDQNCNGRLDSEIDLDADGQLDPEEDVGISCSNALQCPGGVLPDTGENARFDSEDRDGNGQLDVLPGAGLTPFPFWTDRNGNRIVEIGEFRGPIPPDRQFVRSINTNRITGPFWFDFRDNRTRDTLRNDLSWYVDDLLGSHDLKMGLLVEREGFDRRTRQRPFIQVRTGAINPNTGQIGGVIAAFTSTDPLVDNQAGSDNLGLYVQDTYKPLSNLTIGLGLRFDREEVKSHGFDFFEPAAERDRFDLLSNLGGLESGEDDQNRDGIITKSLASDPLYEANSPVDSTRVTRLNGDLMAIAPARFTRHNFESTIISSRLPVPGLDELLQNGRPRGPEDFTITNNNLAPRLSVSWDPLADGKTQVFANWGRFYDKLYLATVVGEEGPDALQPYYFYDSDGVDAFGIPNNSVGRLISSAPPTAGQVDRNLRTPFSDEMTIGFRREIAPEISLSLTYIRRKFRDQLQDIDVNHSVRRPGGTLFCRTTPSGYCDEFGQVQVFPPQGSGGEAGGGARDERIPDEKPDLFIENFNFNQVLRVGNYNTQDYTGYEVSVVRRLSRRWQMTTSYVFSKTTGQAENFLGESGDDPALTELKDGYLAFDQRHVAQVNAVAFLPGDWQLGGGIRWSSGLPYSRISRFQSTDNVDYPQVRRLFGYVDPNSGLFLEENRNINRNHGVYDLNARVQKNFVVGRISAGAFLEVFDLLNSDDLRILEIDNGFDVNQAVQQREFGRRFQVGIQMDF